MEATESYALGHLDNEKGHADHFRHHGDVIVMEERKRLMASTSDSGSTIHFVRTLTTDLSTGPSSASDYVDDGKCCSSIMQYPVSVAFIIAQEFCERFAYYSMRTILSLLFECITPHCDSPLFLSLL